MQGAVRGAVLGALLGAGAGLIYLPELAGMSNASVVAPSAAIGALVGALRAERVLWLLGAALVLLLLLVMHTPIVRPLVERHVRRDPPVGEVDAVVVLSSALTSEGRIARQGLERLMSGMQLARRLRRPLVLSVVRAADRPEISSLADQRELAALASLDSALILVDSVWSTRDEAERVAVESRRRGWRRIAVVTSPMHSRRACATFETVGLAVRCTPAAPRDLTLAGPRPMSGPDERARAFGLWLYERVGTVVYRARGWI
jgi:uncharacterized SAM-binding protein YcdF (DUF218 family)